MIRDFARDTKGGTLMLTALFLGLLAGVCAIAGARNAQQATDNAKAGDLVLSEEELDRMDRASRPVVDLIDDNPVIWKW